MKGIWQSASIQMKMVYFLLLLIASFVLFYLIGLVGLMVGGAPNMLDLSDGNTISVLKWMQACSAIGLFIAPPLLFAYFTNHKLGWSCVNETTAFVIGYCFYVVDLAFH